jgi:hypothetical protein
LQSQVSTTSQISGVVTDQTGAAIAAAAVIFTSGFFRATQITDNRGEFVFPRFQQNQNGENIHIWISDWSHRMAHRHQPRLTLLPATAAEQVTVTANRTGVRLVENATSVTVLSA